MPKSCPSLTKQVEGASKLGEIVKYQKWQQKGGLNMGQYKALTWFTESLTLKRTDI